MRDKLSGEMHTRAVLLILSIFTFAVSIAFADLGDTESQNAARFTTKPIKVVSVDDKTHINVYHENTAFFFNVIRDNASVMEAVWGGALSHENPYDVYTRWMKTYTDNGWADGLGNGKNENGYAWHTMFTRSSVVPSCVIMLADPTYHANVGWLDMGSSASPLVFCIRGSFMYPTIPQTRDRLVEGAAYKAAFNKIWEIRGDLDPKGLEPEPKVAPTPQGPAGDLSANITNQVELSYYVVFKAKLSLENGKVYVDCDTLSVKVSDSSVPNDYKLVAVKHIQAYDIQDPNFQKLKAAAAKGKTEEVYGRFGMQEGFPNGPICFIVANSKGKR